jgi:hypothetical protein
MPGELIEIVFTAATTDSGPIRRHGRNPGTYHVRPHTSVLMLLRITFITLATLRQAVVEHAGLLHFAGCSMHDANDGMAVQTKGALARLQARLEEREFASLPPLDGLCPVVLSVPNRSGRSLAIVKRQEKPRTLVNEAIVCCRY